MTQPNEKLTETIEKALAKASERGVWAVTELIRGSDFYSVMHHYDEVAKVHELYDAHLIANAPEWLRALLEENKRITKENDRLSSPNVESLQYEKGKIDMRLSGIHAMNMLEAFVDLFEVNGGKNFLTTTLEAPARDKRYEVTITNLNGELSSAEKMNQLVAELEQEKQKLKDYEGCKGIEEYYAAVSRLRECRTELEQVKAERDTAKTKLQEIEQLVGGIELNEPINSVIHKISKVLPIIRGNDR